MNNRNISVFVILIIFLFAGCEESVNKSSGNLIELSKKNSKKLIINDFFEFKEFVFLETISESLVITINKVYVRNNKIVILDVSNKSVLIFNRDGSFSNLINKVGRGPGEYLHASDMIVNADGTIEVLDEISLKIIKYNIKGHYISETNLGFRARSFIRDNNNNYIFYTGHSNVESSKCITNPSIVIMNSEFEIINCFLEFDSNWLGVTYNYSNVNSWFFEKEDTVIFIPALPHLFTTFKIADATFEIDHRIEVPDQANIEYFFSNLNFAGRIADEISRSEYPLGLNYYFEYNEYLFFEIYGEEGVQYIYNKTSKESYARKKESDATFGYFRAYPLNGDLKNVVFDIVSPLTFMRSKYEIFKGTEHKLKEDDNPVLVFYNFVPKTSLKD